jgi:hypothetical protein
VVAGVTVLLVASNGYRKRSGERTMRLPALSIRDNDDDDVVVVDVLYDVVEKGKQRIIKTITISK